MTIRYKNYAAALFCFSVLPNLYVNVGVAAVIIYDGSTEGADANENVTDPNNDGVYEIDSVSGTASGSNLFQSFNDFNIANGETALFTDSTASNFNNVIIRVTGGNMSEIYGGIESDAALNNADFYLLNPYGILFGQGSSINIGGSFYASTADQLVFDSAQNQTMSTGVADSSFYAAPVEAFGFINPSASSISVVDTSLTVKPGQTLSLIAGDINLSGNSGTPTLQAVDGTIQIASISGTEYIPTELSDYSNNSSTANISIANRATIDTSGSSGGRIVIRGGSLALDASQISNNNSDIAKTSQSGSQQQAGIDIAIVNNITLDNRSKISANNGNNATSRSNGINIQTGNLTLSNSSSIESTMATGSQIYDVNNSDEGLLKVDATGTISISGRSKIKTTNKGIGNAATIYITAGQINIFDRSAIDASANLRSALGQGGDIRIDTGSLDISGDNNSAPRPLSVTGIQTNGARTGKTNSGSITVRAQTIKLSNNGAIQANSYGESLGGNIELKAESGSIELVDGGQIRIFGNGAGGDIRLEADTVVITGAVYNDNKDLVQQSRIVNETKFSSSTSGNIVIDSNTFSMTDGARISTTTSQNEAGGNVNITANEINISGFNQEILEEEMDTGGNTFENALKEAVTSIDVQSILSRNPGSLDSNEDSGGGIKLSAESINLLDSAIISTTSLGTSGSSGNIDLLASVIKIRDNSLVSTIQDLSYGANEPTGNINIEADNFLFVEQSTISSQVNSPNGSGGNISMIADTLILASVIIDTSANTGDGGNIYVKSNKSLITNDSVFNANSESSFAGTIEIETLWQIGTYVVNKASHSIDVPLLNITPCEFSKTENASTLLISQISNSHYYLNNPEYKFDQHALKSPYEHLAKYEVLNARPVFSDCT